MHTQWFKALLFRHGVIQEQIDAEQRGPSRIRSGCSG